MERIPFDPKELEVVGYWPGFHPMAPKIPIYNTPITPRENFQLLYRGETPLWMPHSQDYMLLMPDCVPDNWARGMVTSDKPTGPDKFGGPDMFGVEWEFVPKVGGAMVRPGKPYVADIEHWEDYVKFPNMDEWDWEHSAEVAKPLLDGKRFVKVAIMTGIFERLISFIEMTDALISLVDEDAQEAVHRLFDKLCDLYETYFAKLEYYFHPDGLWFHDDWGSQRAPFFSLGTVREMILPYLKRICDSAHKHNMILDLHSCGCIETLVPAMIEAGVDSWNGQTMNDKLKVAQTYKGQIIVDAYPMDIRPDMNEEQAREVLTKYVSDFKGLAAFTTQVFDLPPCPRQYELQYEISRKLFNPD